MSSSWSSESEESTKCRPVIPANSSIVCTNPLDANSPTTLLTVGDVLSAGGKTSTIYNCKDSTGKIVVAKVFSSLYRDSFIDEMTVMTKVKLSDSPNKKYLTELLSTSCWMKFDLNDQYTYYHPIIVMPRYYENICDMNDKIGGCDLPTTRRIMRQILLALDLIHSLGFVHGDVKPENILFCRPIDEYENDAVEVKLADFGHSLIQCGDLAAEYSFNIIGTTAFASPEVIYACAYHDKYEKNPQIEVKPAFDIWSCGCIAFEILTDMELFPASSHEYAKVLGGIIDYLGFYAGELPHLAEFKTLIEGLDAEITGGKTTLISLMENVVSPKDQAKILPFLKHTLSFSNSATAQSALELL